MADRVFPLFPLSVLEEILYVTLHALDDGNPLIFVTTENVVTESSMTYAVGVRNDLMITAARPEFCEREPLPLRSGPQSQWSSRPDWPRWQRLDSAEAAGSASADHAGATW